MAAIDTVGRTIYLYGFGREKGVDPYYYMLYKASIDKEGVTLLTPENAQHGASFLSSKRLFCGYLFTGGYGTEIVLKNNQGKVIMELAKPDTRRLKELGWRAPERFTVKAADGLTDIYGIMWKPADFDPNKKYPIISSVYPGPFFEYVNTSFRVDDSYNMSWLNSVLSWYLWDIGEEARCGVNSIIVTGMENYGIILWQTISMPSNS